MRVPWRLVKNALSLRARLYEGPLSDDQEAVLRALVFEAFGGQFSLLELEGAAVVEMAAVAVQIAALYGAPLGLQPHEVEMALIYRMGWTLAAIDETDAASLVGFLRMLPKLKDQPVRIESVQPAAVQQARPGRKPGEKFADEVDWL